MSKKHRNGDNIDALGNKTKRFLFTNSFHKTKIAKGVRKMDVRKTRSGWVMEITNRIGDCLEQGGMCGREVLYSRETLAKCGIDYDSDPEDDWGEGTSYAEYLHRMVLPDRVLKAGVKIE